MADLGSIATGVIVQDNPAPIAASYPQGASLYYGQIKGTYRIDGTAQIAGVTAPNHAVMLMDRTTRTMIATTYSNSSGYFKFDGLNNASENYCVMMMDEGDSGSYNLKALDRITAV